MSGIIIYIPPVPQPPINPTDNLMPVRSSSTFVDSNIKNVVDDYIQTQNNITNDPKGLNIDFVNDSYSLGNPNSCNFTINSNVQQIQIIGDVISEPVVVPNKLLNLQINGVEYFIQLNVVPPAI
jgi:hypothetical protein